MTSQGCRLGAEAVTALIQLMDSDVTGTYPEQVATIVGMRWNQVILIVNPGY